MEKRKVSSAQKMSLTAVSTYLESLLVSFRAGNIVVGKDDDSITLIPGSQVFVEIEAKHKKGKESFSLELSWDTETQNKCDSGEPLYITSTELEKNPLQPPLPICSGKESSPEGTSAKDTATRDAAAGQPAKHAEKEAKHVPHGGDAKK